MTQPIPDFSRFRIILKQTKYPENIGSAARAMYNMGFQDLVLVAPQRFDLDVISRLATHNAAHILDQMQIVDHLDSAISDCSYVFATSARKGRKRQNTYLPVQAAKKSVKLVKNNRIALLFGPENFGLSNTDIERCDAVIHIPSVKFSSINLAQSVMIICYEILCNTPTTSQELVSPRLANKNELAAMHELLDQVLLLTGHQNPEQPDLTHVKLKQFFSRTGLCARDVVTLKGFLHSVLAQLKGA